MVDFKIIYQISERLNTYRKSEIEDIKRIWIPIRFRIYFKASLEVVNATLKELEKIDVQDISEDYLDECDRIVPVLEELKRKLPVTLEELSDAINSYEAKQKEYLKTAWKIDYEDR